MNRKASECLCVDLVDDKGSWIGSLRFHFRGWDGKPLKGMRHELIELSCGSVLDQATEEVSFDEWYRPGCPRMTGKYEFYNVMSVERINDVAYRKAVGRVTKDAWDGIATDEVEITLG
jgi:hypothetical protein